MDQAYIPSSHAAHEHVDQRQRVAVLLRVWSREVRVLPLDVHLPQRYHIPHR